MRRALKEAVRNTGKRGGGSGHSKVILLAGQATILGLWSTNASPLWLYNRVPLDSGSGHGEERKSR